MSEKTGYVVRGTGRRTGRTLWAVEDEVDFQRLPERALATEYQALGEATRAVGEMGGCADVRIFAVAEDGTETPLPTYEEALAALKAAGEALVAIGGGRNDGQTLADAIRALGPSVLRCARCGMFLPRGQGIVRAPADDPRAALEPHQALCLDCDREVFAARDAEPQAGSLGMSLEEAVERYGVTPELKPFIEAARTVRAGGKADLRGAFEAYLKAITPKPRPEPGLDAMANFNDLPRSERGRIKDEAELARDAVRAAGGTRAEAKAAWDRAIRQGIVAYRADNPLPEPDIEPSVGDEPR